MSDAAVIAGGGPGFCEEFAWKLAREGHPVGLFARSETTSLTSSRPFVTTRDTVLFV